ncbi:hypothetical protein QR680_001867 [Steinernema hermaphroditum]|uniref:MYND-type domain-containing protein n=1 Tax=Steinernema hermaphroditum TaxID=289476 RepID=A0AA39LGW6_9BILA|nr:hypothetical protein QR680_001867 [Steinernema hermaphroditum]
MPSSTEAAKQNRVDFYPFAYALYNEELSSYCWYCLCEKQGLRHCTGCGVALFCDKTCQSLAWKDHKGECKAIATHRYDIVKGRDKKDPTFYENRTSKRTIMEIWSHAEQITKDEQGLKKFEEIYETLSKYYDEKYMLPKKAVFELHCRDFINRHAISDKAYLKEIGKGLYLDLCAYDHSCAPNTVYTCKGFIATLRPLHNSVNLLDRSKTFYSYIELFSTKQQRRKMLQDTWYFHCECTRCIDNNDHMLTAMKCPFCKDVETRMAVFGQQPYKDNVTQILTCPECKKEIPQESVLEHVHAMRFVEDIFCRKEIEQALIPLVDSEKTSKLLFLHKEVEECLRLCFPHAHPAVAFHLRNIGIFNKNLKHLDEAKKYFEEAQKLLEYTLDADHPMAVENKQFLDEVNAELTGGNTEKVSVELDKKTIVPEVKDKGTGETKEQNEVSAATQSTFNMTAISEMLDDNFDDIPTLVC